MKGGTALALTPGDGAPSALLTPDDVAHWLGVSPRTVARLPLPCIQLGKRKCRRYRRADVERWLADRVKNGRTR